MDMVRLIEARRDNKPHSRLDLNQIARAAADASVPDYQLAAWLMAAYLNPLSDRETADLTLAMAESGERLDLTGLPKPWVDKHSTGGVGDKTTLVVLPILAACGLTMVKMSGRGLGITGGTVDKLESVPGFNVSLTPEEMKSQAQKIGLALTGQSPRLAPADKTLYALRDVTATVPSVPLIVSSILSKKIAGGAENVVLDVKCGSGAFMETLEEAQVLAESLETIGELAGLKTRARITDMSQPLGRTAGNALEVKEAIRVLKGEEKGRFLELCLTMAATALEMVGHETPRETAQEAITSGRALAKMRDWFSAQGADLAVFDSEDWEVAPVFEDVLYSGRPAYVSEVNAKIVGQTVVALGGGRKTKDDVINHSVGVETLVQVGDPVQPGHPLFRIHAADHVTADQAAQTLKTAVTTFHVFHPPTPVILR